VAPFLRHGVDGEKTHNEKLLAVWSGQKICVRRR